MIVIWIKLKKVYFLFFALTLFITTKSFGYYVSFKAEVSVIPGVVTMNELVEETDMSSEVLEKIVVAYMPYNSKLTLNKRYLVNLIKKRVGNVDGVIDDVPIVIVSDKVTNSSLELSEKILVESEIENIVINELSKYYPNGTSFNLKWRSGSLVEHDNYSISVQITNRANPFVRITLKKSGRVAGYISLQYEAIWIRKIAVSKRRIEKEEIIGLNDVEFVEYNIYSLNKMPVFEEDLPVMADKVFQKGEIIDGKYISDVPLIVKGQVVKAISIVGGVMVSTLVQALENGNVGKVISVKNLENGVIIKGTIQEDGTIIVLEVK